MPMETLLAPVVLWHTIVYNQQDMLRIHRTVTIQMQASIQLQLKSAMASMMIAMEMQMLVIWGWMNCVWPILVRRSCRVIRTL